MIEFFTDIYNLIRYLLNEYGQIGLFLYSVIETITPLAGVEVLFATMLASGYSWWTVALNATIANCVGAAIVYYFMAKEDNKLYNKIVKPKQQVKAKKLFDLYGVWAIFIFAMTPLPFFVIIFTASMARMNFKLYTIVVFATRGIRFFITTYLFYRFSTLGTGMLILILILIALPLTIILFFVQKYIMKYFDKKVEANDEALSLSNNEN